MKNIIYYISATALIVVSFSSCKKYLDNVAINPNDPIEATPNSMLANIELATFASYNGNLNRRSSVFTQHLAGVDGQFVGTANYIVSEGDVTNEWRTIYNGGIVNSKILMDKLSTKSPNFKGIVQVLYVLNIGAATDMWGDIPNKEAGQALDNNLAPHYDTQKSIYDDMQVMLSDAITNLKLPASGDLYFPRTNDYIFGGDAKKWLSVAYVLKARYYNRLSKKNPSQSATDALTNLNLAYANGFTSSSADANCIFGAAANENNQWYAFENGRGYLRMGKFFIDLMKTNSDPRLSLFAAPSGTTYIGADTNPGNATGSESSLGTFYGNPTSSAPLVTFVEAKFIEAECQLRLANTVGAATAHNAAIKESILHVVGASNVPYETAHASETAVTITLTKIMTEKYVALFTQAETYADWRRTGLPVLTPNPSGVTSGIPRILPTSQDERNNNPNAILVSDIMQKVWWDL